MIPQSIITGEVTDVSAYLSFHFWEEVFVPDGADNKTEVLGRWCGPASNIGDVLTYWVLLSNDRLVARSNVRKAKDPLFPNRRARPIPGIGVVPSVGSSGESNTPSPSTPCVMTVSDQFNEPLTTPRFSPEELINLTFLYDANDGTRTRAKVIKAIQEWDQGQQGRTKFLLSLGEDKMEQIISYNELCDIIEEQHAAESRGDLDSFQFREILDHEGPLDSTNPKYMGSTYNVKVQLEDGSITWEPLDLVIKDSPVVAATYAKEHDLLYTSGWRKLRGIARRAKVLQRMLNQARKAQARHSIKYKFGIQIPRNYKEALKLDEENGNTYWQDAIAYEIGCMAEFKVFHSIGYHGRPPRDYISIPVIFVFDVKATGKRRARMVAGGHRTPLPEESVYSSVAALRCRVISMLF